MDQDFIVSELLSELKSNNVRKDIQIKSLQRIVMALVTMFIVGILVIVMAFLNYLSQYDFESESYSIKSANGVYSIVDSDGNVIGTDLTVDELEQLLRGVNNGKSNID